MFDRSGLAALADGRHSALHPELIDAFREALAETLDSSSGLDDAAKVDAIRALEKSSAAS
jgi:hypothetical protein